MILALNTLGLLALLRSAAADNSASSKSYPDQYFKYTDTSLPDGYKSYRALGCTIGPSVNENIGESGSNDNNNGGSNDDFAYSTSNSACPGNDSEDSSSWTQMANCRRAQLAYQVFEDNGCRGQSRSIMTTTGVYAFENSMYKLTGHTVFNQDAISTFKDYEVCTSRGDGTYEMLSCDPTIPGNFALGIFSDATCFVQTGISADLKVINYLMNKGQGSKNFGGNSCTNLDQSYGDYKSDDAMSYINNQYYGFGPMGALIPCGEYDALVCSASSGTFSVSNNKFFTYVKYAVAYAMFGAAALVLLATFEVVHKRRRRKKRKKRWVTVEASLSAGSMDEDEKKAAGVMT